MRTVSGRLSLRARITIIATGLFSLGVLGGTVLLILLLRLALIRELDSTATKAARDVAALVAGGTLPRTLVAGTGGVEQIQVVDGNDQVVAASRTADTLKSILEPEQLARARRGARIEVDGAAFGSDEELRITAQPVGSQTVLAATSLGPVMASEQLLGEVALIGGPITIAAMALLTWWVVGLALRPVAALRYGAEEITAAGLADQRLPVPAARDEIRRLAVTLNAMLDRIEAATARQRTFVGDAAHELRSPIASLRLQLELAARLGPSADWGQTLTDIVADVDRLDRLVADLLALARLDESVAMLRYQPVPLDAVVAELVQDFANARVPVTCTGTPVIVHGDPDGLRRMMRNLVDNAVRHARTAVTVTVGEDGSGTWRRGGAKVVVADDGPGIPDEERERVFDRFFRGDASRSRESGGTGLGLAIVRGLARAHGGSVHLEDDHPGLRAVVLLPVDRDAERQP
jgi:signal transduction histidine kinase